MERISGCQDVFVTKGGTESEPVIGWVTNVVIAENAKVEGRHLERACRQVVLPAVNPAKRHARIFLAVTRFTAFLLPETRRAPTCQRPRTCHPASTTRGDRAQRPIVWPRSSGRPVDHAPSAQRSASCRIHSRPVADVLALHHPQAPSQLQPVRRHSAGPRVSGSVPVTSRWHS